MAVTLREVAERAGVSPRSVSNVVNGFHYVSPQMRSKVEAAIAELGYRPNLLARSLRSGRTGVLGLLVPEIATPYFGELAHAVVEQARELDLRIRIDETGGQRERELELLEELPRSGQVDGILLSAYWLTADELTQAGVRLPLVLFGERGSDAAVDHVGVDNVAAAREITRHLIESGRGRIVAVVERDHPRAPTSRQRLEGYLAAHEAAGVPTDEGLVARTPVYPQRQDGADAVSRLIDAGTGFDAVVCFSDMVATGVLRALADRGLQVPDDVAVVGFDDIAEGRFTVPSLSTVGWDRSALARQALELLGRRMGGDDRPAVDVLVPHRLVLRESSLGRRSAP